MGEFQHQLTYKCGQSGIVRYQAHPFYPSTQWCSACHQRPDENLDLRVRTYVCEYCGLILDRDLNAARNVVWLYTASSAEMDACGETVSLEVLVLQAISTKQEKHADDDPA
jgi:putative transposase